MITKKHWKQHEIDFVKENYIIMSNKEMAEHFGRTTSAIKSVARRQNIKKQSYVLKDNKHVFEQKIDVHADMLEFANSLEKGVKYRRLGPVFNKYGFYNFKRMYTLHAA